MKPPKVIILATCRNPDLIGATELVFKTLRVGFPTAEVVVFDNGNSEFARSVIRDLCKANQTKLVTMPKRMVCSDWLEGLVMGAVNSEESAPFYLCDTDMVFWKSVEDWQHDSALAGRAIPRFMDTYTKCITQPRLHTCLMYLDPARIRKELDDYHSAFPCNETNFNPPVNMVRPFYHRNPEGQNVFYDALAMLSYHVSAKGFTADQLDCFDHLNCGTYADLVEPQGHEGMVERQKAIYENPSLARGLWREQEKFYAHHAI